ncbi:MAG: hypothetical protein AB7V46_25740 [Thermomicrobiales bacterium]
MSSNIAPSILHSDLIALTSNTNDTFVVLASAPSAGQILAVYVTNGATIVGDTSNNRVFELLNGTVSMASITTDTPTTDDIAANAKYAVTLSTTTANRKFAAGDTLTFSVSDNGTGPALTAPARVEIHYLIGAQAN